MSNKYNFKCKYCNKKMTQMGKDYGSNYRFFACTNCDVRSGGVWVDIKKRIDQHGDKY